MEMLTYKFAPNIYKHEIVFSYAAFLICAKMVQQTNLTLYSQTNLMHLFLKAFLLNVASDYLIRLRVEFPTGSRFQIY